MSNKTKRIKAKKMIDEVVYVEDTKGKGRMQDGGYEYFAAQVRNANEQVHNAIYVAQQLEKKVAELEAQNARLREALDPARIADAFTRWPLPASVCADLSATKQGPGRTGTNLLSWVEARTMAEQVVLPLLGGGAT